MENHFGDGVRCWLGCPRSKIPQQMIMAGGCVNRFLEPGARASIENGSPRSRKDAEMRLMQRCTQLYPHTVLRPVLPIRVPAEGPTVS